MSSPYDEAYLAGITDGTEIANVMFAVLQRTRGLILILSTLIALLVTLTIRRFTWRGFVSIFAVTPTGDGTGHG